METDRYARYGAAAGIVFVVLLIVGFLLITPEPPDFDSSANEVAGYYSDNRSDVQWASAVIAVSLFFYVWWLGSLRSTLRAAEGGTGRLSNLAFGGGIASISFAVVALGAGFVAALRPGETSPEIVRAFNDLGVVAGAAAVGPFAALFLATAIVGLRFGALPAPVAWLAAIAGVLQLLTLGTGVTDEGAFSFDGFLGGFLPFVAFLLAILAISIAQVRGEPRPAATAPAPPAQ
jgi:hypothetical protein